MMPDEFRAELKKLKKAFWEMTGRELTDEKIEEMVQECQEIKEKYGENSLRTYKEE